MIKVKLIKYTLTDKRGMNFSTFHLLECKNIARKLYESKVEEKEHFEEEYPRINHYNFSEEESN